MSFRSGVFGAFLLRAGTWEATLAANAFEFTKAGEPRISIPYGSILTLDCENGVLWAEIAIGWQNGVKRFGGIGNADAESLMRALREKAGEALKECAKPHLESLAKLAQSLKRLLEQPHCLASCDVAAWVEKQEPKIEDTVRAVRSAVRNPLFPAQRKDDNLEGWIKVLTDIVQGESKVIEQHNQDILAELRVQREKEDLEKAASHKSLVRAELAQSAREKAEREQAERERAAEALWKATQPHLESLATLAQSLQAFLGRPCYLSNRDVTVWVKQYDPQISETARAVRSALRKPLFPTHRLEGNPESRIELLMDFLRRWPQLIPPRNESFVLAESKAYQAVFDSVEKKPLTAEQRRAAIVMEDRNLLIAAAGSGKTSAVVGKVGYALLRGYVTPEQILVLAFNKKAAQELEERISDRLRAILGGKAVKVKTFHALGLDIIATVTGEKPTVLDSVGEQKMIANLIAGLMISDLAFACDWVWFNFLFYRPAKDPASFTSIEDWDDYVRATGDYVRGRNGYRTLNGELVKSQGEQAIANWLCIKGVNYQYERAYQYRTANQQFRQYYPDFYFPGIDCYLEHYALDAQGRPPPAFGDKYREGVAWKRELHAKKGTDCFETTFADYKSGKLFQKLEAELTQRGVRLRPKTAAEIAALEEKASQGQPADQLEKLLLTFVKHAKSNQVALGTLEEAAKHHSEAIRATVFVRLVSKIMARHDQKLAVEKMVDFEDMILHAARYANEGRYPHPYRLVLVDEFQDLSRARANLLLGLLKHAPDCKLFGVGDDWQSVYRFAGSEISLFTNFASHFGVTATNHLTQTFRSNQGIADVSAQFVQKNAAQVRKLVVAQNPAFAGVIVVLKPERKEDVPRHIQACLEEMQTGAEAAQAKRSVYLLGRYNLQRPDELPEWKARFKETLDIEFKTVHSAKGLEADYVAVLGLNCGKWSFPSLIADDPLLELVVPAPELFPHAEERRLFYVALTRARHAVYLLVSKYAPSSFMVELEQTAAIARMLRYLEVELPTENGEPAEKCPQCGKGWLRKRTSQYGPFMVCSQQPSCTFKKQLASVTPTAHSSNTTGNRVR